MKILMKNRSDLMKDLGRTLKKHRLQTGLSQMALAKALGYSTSQFVCNWERGLPLPPMKTASKLVKMLDLNAKVFKEYFLKIATVEIERTFKRI